ncbi:MAG: SpoIIE family protein phosphatase [Planctomycetes bacterium]|nr:SpoIIE family protein phosphatase [Planctomycetota bacterium]
MARGSNENDIRVGGMKLGARFALTTSAVVVVFMSLAGILLYNAATQATQNARSSVITESMELTAKEVDGAWNRGVDWDNLTPGEITRMKVTYGADKGEADLFLYKSDLEEIDDRFLLVPAGSGDESEDLFRLIVGVIIVVLIAVALASFLVAKQASRPLEKLVNDIRQIARGDFNHRTRVKAGGEIALLARTVDRMASSLAEAQEAEIELEMKEREMEVADEVREALLPQAMPVVRGYDIAGEHQGCPEPGGDFYDFVETTAGEVGLLVCGVSGKGVPGALVGATARAYLRTELATCGPDIEGALKRVNRHLAGDVGEGMFVTALYALLQPATGQVQLACAGHKVPLIRHAASDGKLHRHHPDGFALGFDEGPVFDQALQLTSLQLDPGDRIILMNTGPAQVTNEDGEEIGDQGLYKLLMSYSSESSEMMLDGVLMGLESFAGDEPYPNDLSLMTIRREA